jgi:hypothetical protein
MFSLPLTPNGACPKTNGAKSKTASKTPKKSIAFFKPTPKVPIYFSKLKYI